MIAATPIIATATASMSVLAPVNQLFTIYIYNKRTDSDENFI